MSGPFGSSQWMYNASSGLYGHEISNSLRFNDDDNAYLSFTPSSAGNLKTWSWSAWVKKSLNDDDQVLFSIAGVVNALIIDSAESNMGFDGTYGGTRALRYSTIKTRDLSAWYHVLYVLDTTQGTAANRLRLYVNGVEDALATAQVNTYPAQNSDGGINTAVQHAICRRDNTTSLYFDGYLAEINFIDGTALTPASFGELKNDIWIPKDTSGLTFGTNGYRLQFKQTGTSQNSSGIGADTSGNNNHYAVNNLASTDVVPDSPTNNFATMNPLDADPDVTFSEGNLKVAVGNSPDGGVRGTFGLTSGKWYWETFNNDTGNGVGIGVYGSAAALSSWPSIVSGTLYVTALKNINGTESSYGATYTDDDIIGVALNCDDGEITFYKNNSSQGAITTIPTVSFPAWADGSGAQGPSATINFGQDSSFAGAKTAQGNADGNGIGDFYYAPPSGFLALCTANLPDPVETIDPAQGGSPQDYFNTVLYTGDGNTTQAVTGVGFSPDWLWTKSRSTTDNHHVFDSVRVVSGVMQRLFPNLTSAEDGNFGSINSFDSDGFTTGNNTGTNQNNTTYAAWNWKAGTSFSNDASSTSVGSIDSAGSVSADTGFSIITYTGTGSNATVAHGLSVAPSLYFVKYRNAGGDWKTYSEDVGNTYQGFLEGTGAFHNTGAAIWNNTSPTTSVFSIGTNGGVNTSGGNYVAYLFHSVDGYSKIGKYTANSNADGPFVYTGFRPAWLLIKKIDGAASWWLVDSVRNPFNVTNKYLLPDATTAESAGSDYTTADFVSNGFKIRNTSTAFNSGTHIYMAFAEQPFKYANAR